jgi:PTH1 family peptidyl-tRNA hydrolase
VHDEIDLKFGYYKLAHDSGPAGHNGIKSIIEHLGGQDFNRLRIGVESRQSRNEIPTETFVLQNFSKEERKTLQSDVLPKVEEEINSFINHK